MCHAPEDYPSKGLNLKEAIREFEEDRARRKFDPDRDDRFRKACMEALKRIREEDSMECQECEQDISLPERLEALNFIRENLLNSKAGSMVLFDDKIISIIELLAERTYPTTEAPYELLFGIPVVTAYFPWGEVSYHAYRRHSEFKESLRRHQKFIVPEDCTFLLPE